MFALVFRNKVIQIESDIFPVAPEFSWVECDDSVGIGYDYVDKKFSDSNIENIEQKKTRIKNQLITVRKQYLASTDWQACAFIKYGRPIDEEVKTKCQQANSEIDDIQTCTTITALNKFNSTFE